MASENNVIAIAKGEIGYLEKATNSQLDDKTANAGSKNYTKYARDYAEFAGANYQGQAWCAVFVDWCFVQAFGASKAKALLGGFSAYTPTSANYFKKSGQWYTLPQVGDIIFFKNSTRICHTGIVIGVTASKVTTIEGNTSGGSTLVSNGGGVAQKSYSLSYSSIAGYGRPGYGETSTMPTSTIVSKTSSTPSTISTATLQKTGIKNYQTWLNKTYSFSTLTVDGIPGANTLKASVKALQTESNKLGAKLAVDGKWGAKTKAAIITLKSGSTGNLVYILQGLLYCRGYVYSGFDGKYGANSVAEVKSYQGAKGLVADGIAGKDTFTKLLE